MEFDQNITLTNMNGGTWPKYPWKWPKFMSRIYFGQVPSFMFVSVMSSVMYKFFGHIHSVMLIRSNDYSSLSVNIFNFWSLKAGVTKPLPKATKWLPRQYQVTLDLYQVRGTKPCSSAYPMCTLGTFGWPICYELSKLKYNQYNNLHVPSSIVLGFLNPTSQLRHTDVTAFCMYLSSYFPFPNDKVTPSFSPMLLPL